VQRHDVDPSILEAFGEFVRRADDRELYHANARHIAHHLGSNETATLHLLLAATAEKAMRLGWQVTCPQCAMRSDTIASLRQVPAQVTCANCGHDFESHLDDEISVTFSASPRLRTLPDDADDPHYREEIEARWGSVPGLALLNLPVFHRLAAGQLLPEGQSLGVKELTVFFSDLKRSTAFYHKLGDAQAYHWVSEHFKHLFTSVAAHGGSAVKTIGDGVMGTFTEPDSALRAVVEAMTGLQALNDEAALSEDDWLVLKVGIHCGPCIVVTLNGRVDYFGETVNQAARLNGLAGGGDIVMSERLLTAGDVRAYAESIGKLEKVEAHLRGLPGRRELFRLRVSL
jgi:class 3 adenylate cyclase